MTVERKLNPVLLQALVHIDGRKAFFILALACNLNGRLPSRLKPWLHHILTHTLQRTNNRILHLVGSPGTIAESLQGSVPSMFKVYEYMKGGRRRPREAKASEARPKLQREFLALDGNKPKGRLRLARAVLAVDLVDGSAWWSEKWRQLWWGW